MVKPAKHKHMQSALTLLPNNGGFTWTQCCLYPTLSICHGAHRSSASDVTSTAQLTNRRWGKQQGGIHLTDQLNISTSDLLMKTNSSTDRTVSGKPWPTYQTSLADPSSQWAGSLDPLTLLADPSSKQAGSPGPFTLPHSEQEALAHLPDITGWLFLEASRKPWPTYQTSLADPSSKQAGSPGPLTRHHWLTLPQSGHCLLSPAPPPACWPCCPQHAESEPWPPHRTPPCWKILCQWGQENTCN